MEVDFNTIKEAALATSALGKRISAILDGLDSQAKVHEIAEEIADDIHRLCSSKDPKEKISTILWNLWAVFIEKVQIASPVQEPDIDILVGTLVNLRQRDGAIVNLIEVSIVIR